MYRSDAFELLSYICTDNIRVNEDTENLSYGDKMGGGGWFNRKPCVSQPQKNVLFRN
jgi:hypothetical protein